MQSAPQAPSRGQLLRVLGVGFGVAVTVGNTIGMGILRTGSEISKHLPNEFWFMAVWALGGVLALVAAASVAELATMIPRSAGHYVFPRAALGEYPGFVIGWTDWLSNAGTTAAVTFVVCEYLALLFPGLAGWRAAMACVIILGLGAVHWAGVKVGAGIQNVGSSLKALGFLVLVVSCFLLAPARTEGPVGALPGGLTLIAAVLLSLQAVIYAYDGWAGIVYFSEETTDIKHDIPRSIFWGTLAIMAIYLLVSGATLYVLPVTALAGDSLPVATAAKVIWGGHGDTIMQVLVVISMFSALNAYPMFTARILYSMSVDGLFFRGISRVNKGGTPDLALLISTLASVGFILMAAVAGEGALSLLINVMAFFFTMNYIGDLVAMIVLRRREPQRARPYRAWGYPYSTIFSLTGYSLFLVGAVVTDWANTRWSLLILAVSYPVYRGFRFLTTRGPGPAAANL